MQLQKTAQPLKKTTKYAPSEVIELAKQKKGLIIVDKDFEERFVPEGYVKLKLKSPTDEFIGLMPSNAIFYLDDHNLGNGSIDEGLDVLAALYSEIEAANDLWGETSRINAGGVDLAVTVRSNYQTLLANKLISGHENEDSASANNASYNKKEEERLHLGDKYVNDRIRAIAAIALGKNAEELKEEMLADVLGFKTNEVVQSIDIQKVAEMDPHWRNPEYVMPTDRKHMRCGGGSHYFLKPELRDGKDGWDYDLNKGTRTRIEIIPENLKKIEDLEGEIQEYLTAKNNGLNQHDRNLLRTVANIKYRAGLDVKPVQIAKSD
jgi:hypothetical protein